MDLNDLRGSGVTNIDVTAGKVEPPPPVVHERPVDPQFAPSERIRGSGKRTPTIDNLPEPKSEDVTEETPKEIKPIKKRGPSNLDGEMKRLDTDALPKKPRVESQFEQDLYADLDRAVEAEIESINERMDAVAAQQYKEHVEERDRAQAASNATANADINSMFGDEEGYEPETEITYEEDEETNAALAEFSDEDYTKDEEPEMRYEDPDFFEATEESAGVEEIDTFEYDPDEEYGEDEDTEEEVINVEASEDDLHHGRLGIIHSEEERFATKPIIKSSHEEEVEEPVEEQDDVVEDMGAPNDDDHAPMEVDTEEDVVTSPDMDEFFNKADSIDDDLKAEVRRQGGADPDVDEDKMLDELRTAVKGNISTIKKKINLRDFKVANTPIAASKAISFSIRDINKADWVLPNAQTWITVSGLSGSEIFSLDPSNSNRNRINTFKEIYSIIFRHIENPNKGTFEKWMKTTRYSDISHIYFALYRATFYGSNFIHYECPNCHHVFIKDFSFDELVKYKDEETKKKMMDILNGHITAGKKYPVTRYQVSDSYVMDIKEPSIWNTVIEVASLSEQFLDKYDDLINTIIAIDKIYAIDYDHGMLIPVDPNPVKGNIVQTVANKISTYSDIIKSIPPDAFFDLRTKIAEAFNSTEDMKYVIPECSCPRCQKKIEEQEREGSDLLFTRHQLGALGVI